MKLKDQRQGQTSTVLQCSGSEKHIQRSQIGSSKCFITTLGLGGASLGDLYTSISDQQALNTVTHAYSMQIGHFDTAPWYGIGLYSRMGLVLHRLDRKSFTLSTKVGRFLVPVFFFSFTNFQFFCWRGGFRMKVKFDYSGEAFKQQLNDSLQRLGIGRVDCLVIHDLEPNNFPDENRIPNIANAQIKLEELLDLKTGESNEDPKQKIQWNISYVKKLLQRKTASNATSIDFLLLANMYSLLNDTAHTSKILDMCLEAKVSVIVGGPFSSGILATGADPKNGNTVHYNYLPASAKILNKCRRIQKICDFYSVPLISAALQFPLGYV
eukprot:GSMAST32.ASY1.ANO1.2254.1 assembled CDS